MKSLTAYWQNINLVSISLAPVSLLYCLLILIRRSLYRFGLLSVYRSSLPVIVVGNIYIGGNGKTPLVIELIKQLQRSGFRPAVVSRGYGASAGTTEMPFPRQVNNADIRLFGDEPVLIYQATQCPVFIDPLRRRAVQAIEQHTDCNVIISDDGLQHYAMGRDIEINVTDARRLYGNGLCLPAGPLREPQRRLKSVDYIIYNTSRAELPAGFRAFEDNTLSFSMSYDLLPLRQLNNAELTMTLDDFKGKIVHAVAAIGDPGAFFRQLKQYGLQVIEHPFPDHYLFNDESLAFEDDLPIIMTQKDAVKCQSLNLKQAWYLPVKANIDARFFNQIMLRLTQ